MAIRKISKQPTSRSIGARRPVTASTSVTAGVRKSTGTKNVLANTGISPAQNQFAATLRNNYQKLQRVTAATNTSNISAKPDFLEMLPLFTQQLLVTEVYGSVAMTSRTQVIPFFKFIAEQSKGETAKGTVLNSPLVHRQGQDPNFTGRLVKNEVVVDIATAAFDAGKFAYIPVLPGNVIIKTDLAGTVTSYFDDGLGNIVDSIGTAVGTIEYATGDFKLTSAIAIGNGDSVKVSYEYDNETVGPDTDGEYGARMAKGYLDLDEITLKAEAHELACYWSIFSAFAANQEYGANVGEMAKEASIGELTAEINSKGFAKLEASAAYAPQYNWDAAPVLAGSVVPTDYLNMFKLKLGQAAAGIYQATRLARPNKLIVGTNTAEYIGMLNGFQAADISETVGPYKFGKLDQFDVYVNPDMDPNKWVMACKSDNDIRRNSGLFGEYMPIVHTDEIGLANASVQQGYVTMYAMEVVNEATVVSGRITGTF